MYTELLNLIISECGKKLVGDLEKNNDYSRVCFYRNIATMRFRQISNIKIVIWLPRYRRYKILL